MQEPYSREGNNPSSHSGSFWEREVLREVLLASYKEQRSARIWRNIWRVIGVILFLMFIASLFGDDTDAVQSSGEHTAVIDLKGEIGNELDDQVEMLRTGMEAVYNNPNAKAIIIRANSPGGSPVVSNIAFNEIRRMKSEHKDIPVYVVAEDMCASGCYYIAAAADKIYADPSSVVGSIGVIGGGFDATGLMDKIGIKRRLKTAGFTEIVINHAWLGEQIETTLGDGSQYGVRIAYSPEKAGGLETAGGIATALPLLGDAPFLVVNGDVLTDINFSKARQAAEALAHSDKLACLWLVDNPPHNPDGDFALLANGLASSDKSAGEALTFSGVGVYRFELFRDTPPHQPAKLAPLLRQAMNEGKVDAQKHNGLWLDVGTVERLNEATQIVQNW